MADPTATTGQPKLDRSMSVASTSALDRLNELAKEFRGIEKRVDDIKDAYEMNTLSEEDLGTAISTLAQQNGVLEKLQFVGLDAVTTEALKSGKDYTRTRRRHLNYEVEELRGTIQMLHADLQERLRLIRSAAESSSSS